MSTHADHYLIVFDHLGKQIRGKVVYFQPVDSQSRPQSAVVHIVAREWLASYGYEAVYSTPAHSISGRFTPHGYGGAAGRWLLMGTFEAAADRAHLS